MSLKCSAEGFQKEPLADAWIASRTDSPRYCRKLENSTYYRYRQRLAGETAYPYTTFWLEDRSGRLSALFLQPRLPVEHHRDGIGGRITALRVHQEALA